METFLPIVIAFIFVLAVLGIVAGVSNDATNFMSAAVGTKSATYRTVTIIASLGIIFGSLMSNGMMEIARNGVFSPQYFFANEIVYIYLAVMIANLILLDVFNSLGLPTSTSVSLVFELLGATVAIAMIKMHTGALEGVGLSELINTDKALTMIVGIFLSVAIAFIFGMIVQYITRLIFSFNFEKNLKWKIGIFSGIATTALIYFMLIKGMKGAAFITADMRAWIDAHTWQLLGISFVFFTVLMQILFFLKVNVLKLVVLIGTFALAMAFAGNDLVNFIGVPLAGLDTYIDVRRSGVAMDALSMNSLNTMSSANTWYLIIAGGVMVVTLLTSKKAKIVLQTSLDLSKQNGGNESFGSSAIARSLVRFTNNMVSAIDNILPAKVKAWIEKRFDNREMILEENAAFDLIRGSVSIVLASMLIALGTSLKLPLSTTYVTFMVTMGASLSDRAWSRESAVYRVTGMFSVIGGWFITAIVAFIICFVIALLFYYGGVIAMVAMIALAVYIIIKNRAKSNKTDDNDELFEKALNATEQEVIYESFIQHNRESMNKMLNMSKEIYANIVDAFVKEDIKTLRKASNDCRDAKQIMKQLKRKEIMIMRRLDDKMNKNTWFHLSYNSIEQILYSLRRVCDPCKEYVDNSFTPLDKKYLPEVESLKEKIFWAIDAAGITIYSSEYKDVDAVMERIKVREDEAVEMSREQMNRIQNSKENIDLALLYLNIIQESSAIITEMRHILRNEAKMNE
ncbi:MAG: inorganic phosphate transporter [Bacteroidales bacterium]|nr:inorganic phosphate transporter [Bacteroidales bacterium]MBQ5856745.1 inorganic phosphate transporter [Bacteroidales bacterium]